MNRISLFQPESVRVSAAWPSCAVTVSCLACGPEVITGKDASIKGVSIHS